MTLLAVLSRLRTRILKGLNATLTAYPFSVPINRFTTNGETSQIVHADAVVTTGA